MTFTQQFQTLQADLLEPLRLIKGKTLAADQLSAVNEFLADLRNDIANLTNFLEGTLELMSDKTGV